MINKTFNNSYITPIKPADKPTGILSVSPLAKWVVRVDENKDIIIRPDDYLWKKINRTIGRDHVFYGFVDKRSWKVVYIGSAMKTTYSNILVRCINYGKEANKAKHPRPIIDLIRKNPTDYIFVIRKTVSADVSEDEVKKIEEELQTHYGTNLPGGLNISRPTQEPRRCGKRNRDNEDQENIEPERNVRRRLEFEKERPPRRNASEKATKSINEQLNEEQQQSELLDLQSQEVVKRRAARPFRQ